MMALPGAFRGEASARFSLTAIYSIWLQTNTEDGF